MRDGEAPSYYNPVEASTLVRLVQALLSYSGAGVSVQDIGVIATYRNQARPLLHMSAMQSRVHVLAWPSCCQAALSQVGRGCLMASNSGRPAGPEYLLCQPPLTLLCGTEHTLAWVAKPFLINGETLGVTWLGHHLDSRVIHAGGG